MKNINKKILATSLFIILFSGGFLPIVNAFNINYKEKFYESNSDSITWNSNTVILSFNENKLKVSTGINSFENEKVLDIIPELNAALISVRHRNILDYIKVAEEKDEVSSAEFNFEIEGCWVPNDPFYESGDQSNLEDIGCPAAWDKTKGSYGVRVAVLDTGINFDHKDHSPKQINGKDFVNNDDSSDDHGHGTICAGIISAHMNNNLGISGITRCTVMGVKILNEEKKGNVWNLIKGIIYSVKNNAHIISMSLASSRDHKLLERACNYAENNNVILVASSGNAFDDKVYYPAAYDSVIGVGAVNKNKKRCSFSNYGKKLNIVAPGSNIPSLALHEDDYLFKSGTSFACAHVAGVAALAYSLSEHPEAEEIKEVILKKTETINAKNSLEYGNGLLRADKVIDEIYDRRSKNYNLFDRIIELFRIIPRIDIFDFGKCLLKEINMGQENDLNELNTDNNLNNFINTKKGIRNLNNGTSKNIIVNVSTKNKTFRWLNDPVKINVKLINKNKFNITLDFASNIFYDVIIKNEMGKKVYQLTYFMIFVPDKSELTLESEENISWNITWRQNGHYFDCFPYHQVLPGNYTITSIIPTINKTYRSEPKNISICLFRRDDKICYNSLLSNLLNKQYFGK